LAPGGRACILEFFGRGSRGQILEWSSGTRTENKGLECPGRVPGGINDFLRFMTSQKKVKDDTGKRLTVSYLILLGRLIYTNPNEFELECNSKNVF
jgi:hypothetical protein